MILLFTVLLSACNVNVNVKDKTGQDKNRDTLELMYKFNRDSFAKMKVDDGPIYVIGHRNPDSDTVCSAIAYAKMLTLLGYEAEAAVTGTVNNETAYILKEAGVKEPAILENVAGKIFFL